MNTAADHPPGRQGPSDGRVAAVPSVARSESSPMSQAGSR